LPRVRRRPWQFFCTTPHRADPPSLAMTRGSEPLPLFYSSSDLMMIQ